MTQGCPRGHWPWQRAVLRSLQKWENDCKIVFFGSVVHIIRIQLISDYLESCLDLNIRTMRCDWIVAKMEPCKMQDIKQNNQEITCFAMLNNEKWNSWMITCPLNGPRLTSLECAHCQENNSHPISPKRCRFWRLLTGFLGCGKGWNPEIFVFSKIF